MEFTGVSATGAAKVRVVTTLRRLIVSTSDLAASRVFYGDLLGLRVAYGAPPLVALAADDGTEVLLHERPTTPSDTATSISFGVDDVDRVVAAWRALGGAVIDEPAEQPWGEYQAVVRDADGHVVCLVGAGPR